MYIRRVLLNTWLDRVFMLIDQYVFISSATKYRSTTNNRILHFSLFSAQSDRPIIIFINNNITLQCKYVQTVKKDFENEFVFFPSQIWTCVLGSQESCAAYCKKQFCFSFVYDRRKKKRFVGKSANCYCAPDRTTHSYIPKKALATWFANKLLNLKNLYAQQD